MPLKANVVINIQLKADQRWSVNKMMTSILQIFAAILGGVAALYINKLVKSYMQKWEDEKNEKRLEEERKKASDSNRNLDDELNRLPRE
jgi:phosphate/sulfate permease